MISKQNPAVQADFSIPLRKSENGVSVLAYQAYFRDVNAPFLYPADRFNINDKMASLEAQFLS